jgi:ketosteroid isomerase-like protein
MSERENENVRLVQLTYQSLKSGDVRSLLSSLAPNVEWRVPRMSGVPFSGAWRGHEQVSRLFSRMAEAQDVIELEAKEFIARADKVVALGHFAWRVKSTGRNFYAEWAHIWTVRGAKVTRFDEYTDTASINEAHARTRGKLP